MWSSGLCFALCAFVIRDDRAGVLARRQRPAQEHRDGSLHGDRRPGRPQQASLRRLHRPRRHRADLPGLRRERLEEGRAVPAEAGPGGDGRRLHGAQRRVAVTDDGQKQSTTAQIAVFRGRCSRSTRCIPARSIFRKHENETRRTEVAIRRSIAEDLYIVLAPDIDFGDADHQPADGREPAGQLDLVRVRRAGVRHRHRAAARSAPIRSRSRSCRSKRPPRGATTALSCSRSCHSRCSVGAPFCPDCQGRTTSTIRTSRSSTLAQRSRGEDAPRDGLHLRRLRARAASASARNAC